MFTLGLSILTGMGFSLAPALRASAPNLRDALQSGGRQAFSGTSTVRIRRLLVCAELALTTVLVTGAGLMVRSLLRLERVDLGFSPANVLTTEVHLPGSRYPGGTRRAAAFYDQLTRALGATTGVQSAGAVFMLPLAGDNRIYSFRREDRPDESLSANFRVATPGYFRTIGAPILRGRDFANGDSAGGSRVVLINELMAQRFWPGEDAFGKRIAIRGEMVPREVVGIVRDVRHFGPDVLPEPEMYVPHAEVAVNDMTVVIRTSGDPLRMAGMLEAQVHALDKDLPLAKTRTMGQLFDRSLALRRFALQLLTAFAIGALLLSCIGVYGLVAYSVAQRRQEIGVRMALGAGRLHVLRLLASEIIRLATSGILAGLLGAWLLGRVLSSLLFQTSPTDPVSLVVAAVSLLVVALGACAFPALKATRMNPATAMRNL
jgi:predicted permease